MACAFGRRPRGVREPGVRGRRPKSGLHHRKNRARPDRQTKGKPGGLVFDRNARAPALDEKRSAPRGLRVAFCCSRSALAGGAWEKTREKQRAFFVRWRQNVKKNKQGWRICDFS